jgi:uncharacterized membrane protein YGL010W
VGADTSLRVIVTSGLMVVIAIGLRRMAVSVMSAGLMVMIAIGVIMAVSVFGVALLGMFGLRMAVFIMASLGMTAVVCMRGDRLARRLLAVA